MNATCPTTRLPDCTTIARTPAFLKLDLMCRGLRLQDGVRVTLPRRLRAGLGSGLDLVLPGRLRLNAPVVEAFARQSPYLLRRRGEGHELVREDAPQVPAVPVSVASPPAFLRPLVGTALADRSPPTFEDMFPVFRRLYDRLVDRGIPVGLAPNIRVSIIVTPAEARAFAEPDGFSARWHAYHIALAGKRVLGGLYYGVRSAGRA